MNKSTMEHEVGIQSLLERYYSIDTLSKMASGLLYFKTRHLHQCPKPNSEAIPKATVCRYEE